MAIYHRGYQVYELVEITIEPHRISILSFSGPDRSISMQSIKEARSLRSRRYRNRRLGDFLNGLNLSEGWATGIPTIQNELEKNGSPYATIETDEGRTFFLIDIPCHPEFLKEEEVVSTLSQPLSQPTRKAIDLWEKNNASLNILNVLQILLISTSMKDLLERAEQTNRTRFVNNYVKPLLELELIKMKYPDNPHHQKQQYVLTEIGETLLERLKL